MLGRPIINNFSRSVAGAIVDQNPLNRPYCLIDHTPDGLSQVLQLIPNGTDYDVAGSLALCSQSHRHNLHSELAAHRSIFCLGKQNKDSLLSPKIVIRSATCTPSFHQRVDISLSFAQKAIHSNSESRLINSPPRTSDLRSLSLYRLRAHLSSLG